ncbi:uncharacterized protein GO595_010596 [Histomonas meleagridis]|uniref:uncharacterized protein n=1 Tax=Histomonas meleagridis TaxID=135588 RepID=UPI00355AB83D|nr:hypothetical protein GO595_010596 [Histomonas meleagridis]
MKTQKSNIIKKPVTGNRTPRLKPQGRVPDKQSKIPTKKNTSISKLPPTKVKEKTNPKKTDPPPNDVFEQSERLLKQIKEEEGQLDYDQKVDLPWLEKLDNIEKSLNENIAISSSIDTSIIGNFAISAEKAEITDDPFTTVNSMMDSGFEMISKQLSRESALLKERMSLISQIQEEIMKHPASDYTADLQPDEKEPPKSRSNGIRISKK